MVTGFVHFFGLKIQGLFKGFQVHIFHFSTGLLTACGKKREISQHFQGKLCGKKGPLCGKLCKCFKADLTLFY